jgi:hypothetical protein
MQQPSGRMMPGLNPTLARPLAATSEFEQAVAALALSEATAFTLDPKLATTASQAILTLLSNTEVDGQQAGIRRPKITDPTEQRGTAGALALAIFRLPNADPKLRTLALELCQGILTPPANSAKSPLPASAIAQAEALSLRALLEINPGKTDPKIRAFVEVHIGQVKESLTKQPDPILAAAYLPVLEQLHRAQASEDLRSLAFNWADVLRARQYSSEDSREPRWIGGVRESAEGNPEPSAFTALAAEGLASALAIAVQAGDLTRYDSTRRATLAALAFCQGLQFTEDNTHHFERKFRDSFLLGGVATSVSEGNPRLIPTGTTLLAQTRYLHSGGDRERR